MVSRAGPIRRLQHERPVGTVLVVMLDVDPKDPPVGCQNTPCHAAHLYSWTNPPRTSRRREAAMCSLRPIRQPLARQLVPQEGLQPVLGDGLQPRSHVSEPSAGHALV